MFTWLSDKTPRHEPGFLGGMPVAVKDLMAVTGIPMSGGSAAVEDATALRDAEVIARLRRAGAVFIGATNLHELAYGITSDNPRFGRVTNPAVPDRIPGGSSGGSAAAIAAGIVHVALGTDTAGSIRVPAACCGIVGFKPSYDVLPRDGVMDLAPSLDHVGPLGRTVADTAALFAAMLDLPSMPAWRTRPTSVTRSSSPPTAAWTAPRCSRTSHAWCTWMPATASLASATTSPNRRPEPQRFGGTGAERHAEAAQPVAA